MVEKKMTGKRTLKFNKSAKVLLIVGALAILLVVEVVLMTKKKMRENVRLTCLASYDYHAPYRDMAIGKDGTIYILYSERGVEKVVNGKPVKKWDLAARGVTPAAIALTNKYVLITCVNQGFILRIDRESGEMSEAEVAGFQRLGAIATDMKDRVYVCDSEKHKIIVLSEAGEVKLVFGDGGGKERLLNPGHLTVDDDYLYVFSCSMKKINKYTKSGKFKGSWDYFWEQPTVENIATDGKGKLYVNDHVGSKIWIFSTKGKLIGTCNEEKTGTYQIIAPGGIADGRDGFIYLCSHKIGKFQPM